MTLRYPVLFLAGMLGFCFGLTGCGPSSGNDTNVACRIGGGTLAVAAGMHANAPAVRFDGQVRTVVEHAVAAGAGIQLVRTDGAPELVWRRAPSDDTGNDRARTAAVETALGDLAAALGRAHALAPQVDDLTALGVAARAARSGGPHPTPATVLLLDSGLQTLPPLDFSRPGVLTAEPTDIVAQLERTGQLPDLSGIDVLLAGLGATAAPQAALTDAQIHHLTAIYTAVAEAAGAHCVAALHTSSDRSPVTGGPEVALVPVPAPVEVTPAPGMPIVFGNDTMEFRSESEEFADPTAAANALRPIVAALDADPNARLSVTGTCASGTGHGRDPIELSTARATAVTGLLTAAGIARDRITALGVGTGFPEFVPDLDAAGNLLPGPAAQNRSVRLLIRH